MITYKKYSNVGNREVNEDSIGDLGTEYGHMFVLADGLGGHGHGENASAIAVETALELLSKGQVMDILDNSFALVQQKVLMEQNENPALADMKTTMVALLFVNNSARWGHIGDSRLYHFRNGKLNSRTLDHSVPQMLVNIGEITEDEIRGHEDRNRLLRVIGSPWESKSYDIADPIELKKKDAFLLCSDGFWELIDEKTMQKFLKKASTVTEWMELMIEEVNRNGVGTNMDNNSGIAIWVD